MLAALETPALTDVIDVSKPMPCDHRSKEYLYGYLIVCGIARDRKGSLFRTVARGIGKLRCPPARGQRLSDGAASRCGTSASHALQIELLLAFNRD